MSSGVVEFKKPLAEKTTAWYRAQFIDGDTGNPIVSAAVDKIEATLVVGDASSAVINGRNAQNVLNMNGGEMLADGWFRLKLGPDDTVAIGPSRQQRRRLTLHVQFSTEGFINREITFYIQNLTDIN
jgi:hypothetical protein